MLDNDGQTHLRVMEHSYGAENGLYDESAFFLFYQLNYLLIRFRTWQTNFLQPLHHSH